MKIFVPIDCKANWDSSPARIEVAEVSPLLSRLRAGSDTSLSTTSVAVRVSVGLVARATVSTIFFVSKEDMVGSECKILGFLVAEAESESRCLFVEWVAPIRHARAGAGGRVGGIVTEEVMVMCDITRSQGR